MSDGKNRKTGSAASSGGILSKEISFGNKKKNNIVSVSGKGKGRHNALPQKRTINLAVGNNHEINKPVATVGIIIVVFAAALFSKFCVVDVLSSVSKSNQEVAALQQQIDDDAAAIEAYGDLNEEYDHYTYSGLTEEELGSMNRVEAIQTIESVVMPKANVGSWTITGNQLNIPISGSTLSEVNAIVSELEQQDCVSYCTVTTAEGTNGTYIMNNSEAETIQEEDSEDAIASAGGESTVQVTVYLKTANLEDESSDSEADTDQTADTEGGE